MSGSSDDVPARGRGAVRPPPSLSPGDAPDSVDVPRMEPPPPSLEAMVQSQPGSSTKRPAANGASSWLLWLLLVVVAAGITAYVTR